MILPELILTKLKLEYMNFDLHAKRTTDKNCFASLKFEFAFRICPDDSHLLCNAKACISQRG